MPADSTPMDNPGTPVVEVRQEDVVKFLGHTFRNIRLPRLSNADVDDIRDGLEHFARHRIAALSVTPEGASQALQDHMEQQHGVCLKASEWDAAVRAALSGQQQRDGALASLRAHVEEQITHVEQRIADGNEMGAAVWRIALEDVARENRAALDQTAAAPPLTASGKDNGDV